MTEHTFLEMSSPQIHPYMFEFESALEYESGQKKKHLEQQRLERDAFSKYDAHYLLIAA